MLAVNHATLSTASVLGFFWYTNQPLFLPLILVAVFAGVAPDIDHPGSELGKLFKPIGRLLPHRGVTHSFLGIAVFAFLINLTFGNSSAFTYIGLGVGIFGVYLAEKILHQKIQRIDDLTLGFVSQKQINLLIRITSLVLYLLLISLCLVSWQEVLRRQLWQVLVIAYTFHIVGDWVTIEGVPLFWPIKKKLGLKIFRTGSWFEGLIGFGLIILCGWLIYQLNLVQHFDTLAYWKSYLPF
jgi:membrane-bound metal-dependent hydrolase YbcI (DUF457 family)